MARKTRHPWPFLIVGLTGSVAMGKSTATRMIERMGIPVFDADAAVHALSGINGRALPAIARRFPGLVGKSGLDRQALGEIVYADSTALRDLEEILHPLVKAQRLNFLRTQALRRARCVVLDVPLLLETKGAAYCDAVIVVSAPRFLQSQRAMARPGMTVSRYRAILARQMPDHQKRRQATVTVPTSLGKRETWRRLCRALAILPLVHSVQALRKVKWGANA